MRVIWYLWYGFWLIELRMFPGDACNPDATTKFNSTFIGKLCFHIFSLLFILRENRFIKFQIKDWIFFWENYFNKIALILAFNGMELHFFLNIFGRRNIHEKIPKSLLFFCHSNSVNLGSIETIQKYISVRSDSKSMVFYRSIRMWCYVDNFFYHVQKRNDVIVFLYIQQTIAIFIKFFFFFLLCFLLHLRVQLDLVTKLTICFPR